MSSALVPVVWQIVKTGTEIGLEAYKNRSALSQIWDAIQRKLFGQKYKIAITGAAGAGKTVLLDYLQGKGYEPGYEPPGRSIRVERSRLDLRTSALELTSIPGQTLRMTRTNAVSEVFFGKEPLDGVIHVVANGFLDPWRLERPELEVAAGLDTVTKYTEASRIVELRDWYETVSLINWHWAKHRKPLWLVIVLSKIDLYPQALLDAKERYTSSETSEFWKIATDLQRAIGTVNLEMEVVPVCTHLSLFRWNGEEVRPNLLPDERHAYLVQLGRILKGFCDG